MPFRQEKRCHIYIAHLRDCLRQQATHLAARAPLLRTYCGGELDAEAAVDLCRRRCQAGRGGHDGREMKLAYRGGGRRDTRAEA